MFIKLQLKTQENYMDKENEQQFWMMKKYQDSKTSRSSEIV